MKKFFTLMGAALISMNVAAQKIDFDFQGKSGGERHTEAGFLNWPIGSKGVVSDTLPRINAETGEAVYPASNSVGGQPLPAGMQIIVCNPAYVPEPADELYAGVVSVWAKNNVESNTLSKIPGDAVSSVVFDAAHDRYNPADWSTLRFIIKGMAPGNHTLLTYHNCSDAGNVQKYGPAAMVKVLVNGEQKGDAVRMTAWDGTNKQSVDDIASTFISFTVEEGKDVVIDYVPFAPEGVETEHHMVYVNGMVFDAVDPNMKVTNMSPTNTNMHVDAPGNSLTLSWVGSPSAASHRVMFGTSEDNLQEVQNSKAESYTATGLSNLNVYYWRVDEVPASGEAVPGDVYSFRINQLAFPGAEGFGRFAYGGRGGKVVHVTSLEDDGTEGTLRWALETVTGPRTVVFDISGIITLTKRITVNEPYVTIAGQTAPGDGIMVRGSQISLHSEGITRFMRMRLGSVINEDKFTGYSCVDLQGKNNSIVDHSSIEWGTAETFKAAGNYTSNLTIQHTIISEALTNGTPGEDGFGYGFEAGGEYGSFHHNLMANNYMHNPRIAGGNDASLKWIGEEEYYNNVAYNWAASPANGSAAKINFVGNYYKAGQATTSKEKLLNINVPSNGSGTIDYYVEGNLLEADGTIIDNPYAVNPPKDEEGNPVEGAYVPAKSDTKVIDNGAVYEDAKTAYANVLSQAGASLKRDKTDQRIVRDVLNGTSSFETAEKGMIANVEASDFDVYEIVQRPENFDANQNGIADWYEAATGKSDPNADPDGDGYTNLEDYLNYMATPNASVDAGATASFNLADYFAGIGGADIYSVDGSGAIEGTTLKVTPTAADKGILQSKVTATKGDVSVSRQFYVYVNGTQTGIKAVQGEARVASYEVYNAAGQLVARGQANGATVNQLNMSAVGEGVHILKIKDTEGRSRSFSVIKK